jgi:hypothetical protein
MKTRLICILGLLYSNAFAQLGPTPEAVTVMDVGSIGKAIVIDRGTLEGVGIGNFALLYYAQAGKDPNYPNILLAGEAEALKVHDNYSYWMVKKVAVSGAFSRGRKLLMFRRERDPRRPLKGVHGVVVTDEGQQESIRASKGKAVPNRLIFADEGLIPGDELQKTTPSVEHDIKTRAYTTWQRSRNKEWAEGLEDERDLLYKAPAPGVEALDRFRSDVKAQVHQLSVEGAVAKVNGLRFGLTGLLADAERDGSNTFKQREVSESLYEDLRSDMKNKKDMGSVSPRARSKIERDGGLFSAGMEDDQLRQFVVDTGLGIEARRLKEAQTESAGHEVLFRYTTALARHTTAEDPNNQGTDYFVSLGYEFHLGRTGRFMRNFSAEVELERGVAHYDLGGINGRFEEGSLKGYLNWYFWNNPASVQRYMPYAGIGLRRGNAEVTNPELSKDYTYQFQSMPSFHFGLKYRFKSGDTRDEAIKLGLAVNFLITIESVRHNAVNSVVDEIEPVLETGQTKMGFGLSMYF